MDFIYQNTYSYDIIRNHVASLDNFEIEFINDEFSAEQINQEYHKYKLYRARLPRLK